MWGVLSMEERFGLSSIYQTSDGKYNVTVTDDEGKVHVIAQGQEHSGSVGLAKEWCYGAVIEKKGLRRRVLPPLVGISEAADIIGWDRRKVSVYLQRGSFPSPEYKLASGPVWTREQIEEFRDNQAKS